LKARNGDWHLTIEIDGMNEHTTSSLEASRNLLLFGEGKKYVPLILEGLYGLPRRVPK